MLSLILFSITLYFYFARGQAQETNCLAGKKFSDLHLRLHEFVYDLKKNRANVSFIWDEFRRFEQRGKRIRIWNYPVELRMSRNYSMKIFRVHDEYTYKHNIVHFSIPDINGCSPPQNLSSYCDGDANCQDLPANDTAPASCNCKFIYKGDGINNFWGGSGCTSSAPYIILLFIVLFAGVCSLLYWYRNRYERRRKHNSFSLYVFNHDQDSTFESLIQSKNGIFGSKWEIERTLITFEEVIGRGNFGIVHKAILEQENEQHVVAVKTVSGNILGEGEFLAEINLLISLGSHANIASIIGCCTTKDNPILLVTEYMMYGDLLHFMWDIREPSGKNLDKTHCLKQRDLYDIGRQVADGMAHLKNMKVIHGDLAARNILVGENLICKITDFGLANDVYRYGMIRGASEKRVPYKWISPERMMNGSVPITWRSDIWSFGILLYEMVSLGEIPYPGIGTADLLQRLKSGYRMSEPAACNPFLYKLMRRCWQWTPSRRPSFKELGSLLSEPVKEDTIITNPFLTEVKALYQKGLELPNPLEQLQDIKVLISD